MFAARLAFPMRGWAKISWDPDDAPPAQISSALVQLAEIPGVRWDHAVIEIPETVWAEGAFWDVLDEFELSEKFGTDSPPIPRTQHRMADIELTGQHHWRLYPWQVQAVSRALDTGHLLLCDDMGLGKTRSALAAADWFTYENGFKDDLPYTRRFRPNVIIAPGFTVDVWRRELLATGLIDHEDEFCVVRSRDHNATSWRKGCRWYFIHYDIVHAWASHITLQRPLVAIIDEIHWCKNGRSQRAQGTAMATGRALMRIGLTGTPMANRVNELWAPLQILTGKGTWGSPIDFRRRYAGAVRGEFGYQDRKPTNTVELRQRLAPYFLRRTIDDIDHDLPPLRRERITVEMSDAARLRHDRSVTREQMSEMVAALVQGRAGEQALRLLSKLRKETSKAKLQTTARLVVDLLDQGQSVVVFCWQRETVGKILALAEKRSADMKWNSQYGWALTGEVPQAVRDEAVEDFQAYGGLLCATYGVLKEGVTLTKARAVVLHDLDWVPSNILQAEKRIHRLGQNQACMSYWMVAEDSIDTILARLLITKAEHIEAALGITAPKDAADELNLADLVTDYDPAEWARAQMERWFE